MRRRVKEPTGTDVPPLPLTRYRGRTNREALAWIRARDEWWTQYRDPDDPQWLAWLLDGYDQVGNLRWCGSVGPIAATPIAYAWPGPNTPLSRDPQHSQDG